MYYYFDFHPIFFPKRVLGRVIQIFAVLLLSILVIMFLAAIIGGIFGLLWRFIANAFGYTGSATDALSQLGDPHKLFAWIQASLDFVYKNIIKPIWDWLTSLWR